MLEVPIEEGNRLIKKGDVLFRIDPTPYQLEVNSLNAQLATAQASQRELLESQKGANAKTVEARATIAEATSKIAEVTARLDLARKRVVQNRELATSGAGNRFDLEQAETSLAEAQNQLAAANSQMAQARAAEVQSVASAQQVGQKLSAQVEGQFAQVAQIRAQLETAKWNLAGQFAVKFDLAERDRELFLAAGAVGNAAIYTQHVEAIQILRKVIVRVGSYMNYLILKLH